MAASSSNPLNNLAIYPVPNPSHSAELTIGDLHGNAIKLIHFLIREGVLELKPEDYTKLVQIYKNGFYEIHQENKAYGDKVKGFPSQKSAALSLIQQADQYFKDHKPSDPVHDITEFKAILERARIIPGKKIRLIGDELADRGSNDYFTLKILQKLKQGNVSFETIWSNHGHEALLAMENDNYNPDRMNLMSEKYQAVSMLGLDRFYKTGAISKTEMEDLKQCYRESLKIISYTKEDKGIVIHSHAGIGLNTIKDMVSELNKLKKKFPSLPKLTYDDSSLDKLAKTIDGINNLFSQLMKVKDKGLSGIQYLAAILERDLMQITENKKILPSLNRIIWGRGYHDLQRPVSHKKYNLTFIHGHDNSELSRPAHVKCIDNMFGKAFLDSAGETYEMNIYRSSTRLAPVHTLKDEKKPQAQQPPKEKTSDPPKNKISIATESRPGMIETPNFIEKNKIDSIQSVIRLVRSAKQSASPAEWCVGPVVEKQGELPSLKVSRKNSTESFNITRKNITTTSYEEDTWTAMLMSFKASCPTHYPKINADMNEEEKIKLRNACVRAGYTSNQVAKIMINLSGALTKISEEQKTLDTHKPGKTN